MQVLSPQPNTYPATPRLDCAPRRVAYNGVAMADPHQFKIVVGPTPITSSVEIDGVPLRGMRRVSFELDAGEVPFMRLDIFGEALVEGHYVESEVLAIERPAKDVPK